MSNVHIFKSSNPILSSLQKSGIEDNFTAQLGVIQHPINYRSVLEFCEISSVHNRCLDLKSSIVAGLGYTFTEEESKIKPVLDFINSITDKFTDNNLSFEKLNKELMFFYYALNRWALEVRRAGSSISVYSKKTHDLYIHKNWTKMYQITDNNQSQEFSFYQKAERGLSELILFSKNYALSDYYTMPDYYSTIRAMTINALTEQYSIAWLNQAAAFDIIVTITGDTISEEVEGKVRRFIDSKKGALSAGQILFLDFPNTGSSVQIQAMNQTKRDQFIEIENQKERQIIQAHGIPTQLLGIDQSGAISSGEKATGNLKIFKQLLRPDQVELEKFWNWFFEKEFGINPGIKFNSIDLTDQKEDAEIENIISNTYAAYSTQANSLQLVNEFRDRINLPALTDSDWNNSQVGTIEAAVNKRLKEL